MVATSAASTESESWTDPSTPVAGQAECDGPLVSRPRRKQWSAALLTFVLTLVAALVLSGNAFAEGPAAISSDKPDYAPGEQVRLYGSFWGAGESVHINVNDDAGQTWTHDADVIAALDGSFTYQFILPDWFIANYTVRANGSSGSSATTTFTDAAATLQGESNPACTSGPQCDTSGGGGWENGNLKGWAETDLVPVRAKLTGGFTNEPFKISYDKTLNSSGGTTFGLGDFTNFQKSDNRVSFTTPTRCDESGPVWAYCFTVTTTGTVNSANPAFITFSVPMAVGAHNFAGNSMQLGGDLPGGMGQLQVSKPAALAGSPDLEVVKTCTAGCTATATSGTYTAPPDTDVTFKLAFKNASATTTAPLVSLRDIIEPTTTSPKLTYVASSCTTTTGLATNVGCSVSGNIVTWNVGTLTPGAAGEATLKGHTTTSTTFSAINEGNIQNPQTEAVADQADNVSRITINNSTPKANTTVSAVSGSGAYGGTGSLTATLKSGTTPLSGKTLSFKLNGTIVCGGASQPACPTTDASGVATLTGVSLSGINANTYTNAVDATFAGDVGFNGSSASGNLVVNTAPLSVIADANPSTAAVAEHFSKTYGDANPAFSVRYSGFVNGEAASDLGGSLGFDTTATAASPVGAYDVTPTGLSSNNYAISFVKGTLDIGKRAITVRANNVTRTYGNSMPAFSLAADAGSLASGDTLASLGTPAFGFDNPGDGVNVGTYRINVSGLSNGNYDVSYASGTNRGLLTIVARPITIKADNQTKVYGTLFTFDGTEFSVPAGSLAPGDSVTVTLTSAGAAKLAPVVVGGYAIVPSAPVFTSGPATNYNVTLQNGTLTVTARDANVAYIGQTVFFTSGSSSTTAQVTLSASVADTDGSGGTVADATVTFRDLLQNKILASGVKVSPVSNSDTATGTANTIVTLSTGQYGAQEYLIEVSLGGSYKNTQQTGAAPGSTAYEAAHPTVSILIPPTTNSTQGVATLPKLATAAGTYGNASSASYTLGFKYNKGGSNPQGQIQLILQRSDGTYYVKSNSITSLGFLNPLASNSNLYKDVTVYTKASIYKVSNGLLTSIDGNVSLRVDAHEGCTTSPSCANSNGDSIGFTVLSSKTSALYYSNNWVYSDPTKSWRTVPQDINGSAAVVIN